MAKAKKTTVQMLGGPVSCLLKETEDGYECFYDKLSPHNRGDDPTFFLDGYGRGETESEAKSDYIRSCVRAAERQANRAGASQYSR